MLPNQEVQGRAPVSVSPTVPLLDSAGAITLGTPNEWRFYSLTNSGGFTNACFAVFNTYRSDGRGVADVDLYVSTNSALVELDPGAVSQSWKSLERGGSGTVLLSDAQAGTFYIGVKSECAVESHFTILGAVSEVPFYEGDPTTALVLKGLPVPLAVPDARGGGDAGYATMFAVSPFNVALHRVVVSNTVSHTHFEDLKMDLRHGEVVANLVAAGTQQGDGERQLIFDDSAEKDVPGARPSSGPGTLRSFVGARASGQWLLPVADVAPGSTGTVSTLWVALEPEGDLSGGMTITLLPGAASEHAVFVPANATNLCATFSLENGAGEAQCSLQGGEPWSQSGRALVLNAGVSSGTVCLNKYFAPLLNAGRYLLRVQNTGTTPVVVSLRAEIQAPSEPARAWRFASDWASLIHDASITTSAINVAREERVVSVNATMRIVHPRVSDLAITLVSPRGTRVSLSEQRGGSSTEGFGLDNIVTNTLPVSSSGGPLASTNMINVGVAPGSVTIQYSFYDLPDEMRIYRGAKRIFDSGMVGQSGEWVVPYDADLTGKLTVVMNEGDNYETNTAWDYVITATRPGLIYAAFSDEAAAIPVKFAPPPFTNAVPTSSDPAATNAVMLAPEESLDRFRGEPARGDWTLEIEDRVAGPAGATTILTSWELYFVFEDSTPLPVPLVGSESVTAIIAPGGFQNFVVDVPGWARRATNILQNASAAVEVWYNGAALPTGTNSSDRLLGTGQQISTTLSESSDPALVPGGRYFLGIRNTGAANVSATMRVDFDVIPLASGVPAPVALDAAATVKYFSVDVATNTATLSLQLTGLVANLDLVARKGTTLPTTLDFDYGSFNGGSMDEEIVVTTAGVPLPLSAGRWSVGVLNRDMVDATGWLTATQLEAPPRLTSIVLTNQSVQLTWDAPTGSQCSIEWTSTLDPPNWQAFPEVITVQNGFATYVDASAVAEQRYYRVVRLK